MARVTVHHDRLSRYSAILMILLGVVTLLFVSGFVGIILIAVGAIMLLLYRRQSRRAAAAAAGGGEDTSAL